MYDFWEALIGRISTTAGGLVKSSWDEAVRGVSPESRLEVPVKFM